MERAVRRPVPAIRADACGESANSTSKYQSDGRTRTRTHNPASVSRTQGRSDRLAHCASDGVPRALSLRTASVSPDSSRKASHAGTTGDAYSAHGQADAHCTEASHSDDDHGHRTGNTSERLDSFGAHAAATRMDRGWSFDGRCDGSRAHRLDLHRPRDEPGLQKRGYAGTAWRHVYGCGVSPDAKCQGAVCYQRCPCF